MMPDKLSKRIITDRLSWVDRKLDEIRKLPLASKSDFLSDSRNLWAAESCLRRALEAVFDLGRHILAKGYGAGTTEYKEIAVGLGKNGVLEPADVELLRRLAGYRNRLVHFYHDVSADEIYEVCALQLGDVGHFADALRKWIAQHSDRLSETL